MKSKFKIFGLLIIVCLAICAVLAGCLTDDDYEAIYGDDSKIARSTSSTSIGSVKISTNGSYELSCASFSGVKLIEERFHVNEYAYADLSSEVEGGKFKLVLVGRNNDVYTLAEGGYEGALELSGVPEGVYKIKIVGVNAEIKFRLTFDDGVAESAGTR